MVSANIFLEHVQLGESINKSFAKDGHDKHLDLHTTVLEGATPARHYLVLCDGGNNLTVGISPVFLAPTKPGTVLSYLLVLNDLLHQARTYKRLL